MWNLCIALCPELYAGLAKFDAHGLERILNVDQRALQRSDLSRLERADRLGGQASLTGQILAMEVVGIRRLSGWAL